MPRMVLSSPLLAIQSTRAYAASRHHFLPCLPGQHYQPLVGKGGNQCLLGISSTAIPNTMITQFMGKKRSLTGSGIGSIKESIELIAFADKHQIYPEVELFGAADLNKVYTKMGENADGLRYVMECNTITPEVDTGNAPTIGANPGDIKPGAIVRKLFYFLCCGPGLKR